MNRFAPLELHCNLQFLVGVILLPRRHAASGEMGQFPIRAAFSSDPIAAPRGQGKDAKELVSTSGEGGITQVPNQLL